MFNVFNPSKPTELGRQFCNNLTVLLVLLVPFLLPSIVKYVVNLTKRAYVCHFFVRKQYYNIQRLLSHRNDHYHRHYYYCHHQQLFIVASRIMVDPLKIFWVLTNSTYLGKYCPFILYLHNYIYRKCGCVFIPILISWDKIN